MTIRWGLLGCGDVARKRVAAAIQQADDSELLAACRRDEQKLDEFCREFEVPRAYTSDAELLADPDIDAVYIATPVHLHLPQTLAASAAGKHVLVEKPMAMSVAECVRMIDACRRSDVRLGVAYYRRFYPVVRRITELLAAGEIGTPMAAHVITATEPPTIAGEEGAWRVLLAEGGGGPLMDIGSHRINLLLSLFGEVAKVTACCGRVAAEYEAEDCASLVLVFASKLQAVVQCLFGPADDPDIFSIIGTRGRISSAPLNDGDIVIECGGQSRRESHPPADNFCLPQIADFVAAIREHRDPLVSGEEGRLTNVVIEHAYQEAGK